MIYLQLIYVFFKIGLFGFGGGYAMLSLIQHEVCDDNKWMTIQEFADIIAISQMTPGPVSINIATYVGFNVAGFCGAVVATLALCMPAIILMYFVIKFLFKNRNNRFVEYAFKWLKPAVAGLILSAALMLMNKENFCDFGESYFSVMICVATFVASYYFKVNTMLIIPIAGILGLLIF